MAKVETKPHSLFVGQLSWNVDKDRLAQEFSLFGEVVSTSIPLDRYTGRSRGFGYVHFANDEALEKALEDMNGKEIDGRAIRVDKSTGPPTRESKDAAGREKRDQTSGNATSPPSTTLFIGNLPFATTEDGLSDIFSEWEVRSARIPTYWDTGRSKGFGYVEFESLDGAKGAFEAMQGLELDGRVIRLDFSEPKDQLASGGGRGWTRGGGGFGGHSGRSWRGRGRGRY
ncbi:nuclear localization sequence binding protein [Marasmius tenuissimus]|uniref:Nuclear localization sequence binding protein n=1 Tax=Marasmius tenuissimus TaxID=585030 RepID=A0ABR2ZAG6_9AGAR